MRHVVLAGDDDHPGDDTGEVKVQSQPRISLPMGGGEVVEMYISVDGEVRRVVETFLKRPGSDEGPTVSWLLGQTGLV